MADAAARQLQYEYKAVSKKYFDYRLKIFYYLSLYYYYYFLFFRTQILCYKLMCALLIDATAMKLLVKYARWLENWKAQKWVIAFKELNQLKQKKEKQSK